MIDTIMQLFREAFHTSRKSLQKYEISSIIYHATRGYGAVGSASEWHSEGQGFESPYLH